MCLFVRDTIHTIHIGASEDTVRIVECLPIRSRKKNHYVELIFTHRMSCG